MMHHHESFWTGCGPHARAAWEEAAPWIAAASGFFGADAFAEDSFDAARAAEAGRARVESAERMRQATVRALDRLHRVLRPEQRAKLALLIRTGAVVL